MQQLEKYIIHLTSYIKSVKTLKIDFLEFYNGLTEKTKVWIKTSWLDQLISSIDIDTFFKTQQRSDEGIGKYQNIYFDRQKYQNKNYFQTFFMISCCF